MPSSNQTPGRAPGMGRTAMEVLERREAQRNRARMQERGMMAEPIPVPEGMRLGDLGCGVPNYPVHIQQPSRSLREMARAQEQSQRYWTRGENLNTLAQEQPAQIVPSDWTPADEDEFVRKNAICAQVSVDAHFLNEIHAARGPQNVERYVREQLARRIADELQDRLIIEYDNDYLNNRTNATVRMIIMPVPTLRESMKDLKRACVRKLTEMFNLKVKTDE